MHRPKLVKSVPLPAVSWEAYSASKPTRNKRRVLASPEARPKVSVQLRSVRSSSRLLAGKGPKHLLLRTPRRQMKVTRMQILVYLAPTSLWKAILTDQLKYIPMTRITMTLWLCPLGLVSLLMIVQSYGDPSSLSSTRVSIMVRG